MTHQFHELLLSELRMVTYQPGTPAAVTDEMLCLAVTLNENIRSLGYQLRPDDILRLAASPSLTGFFGHLKALVPDVKDKPMYPGFPQQVMEMSEAAFRLHQMIHYFSTYGLEDLLGVQVRRGWLPEYDAPERTEKDTILMDGRVIELVAEQESPAAALRALLDRRERLTNPELALVTECAPLCSAEQLQDVKVRFKENIDLLFPLLMKWEDRETALRTLHAVCAHTGDVLECSRNYLGLHKYHLTTSEKKLLVRLLESYPVHNLRLNLMQSLHRREQNLKVLRHLDYNRFSRSEEHREAVRALRNGELLSWHGVGEALLRERSPEALNHFAQRPGYMVRMLNRLLSLGYDAEDIAEPLLPHSGAVSAHLIVKTLRTMMFPPTALEQLLQSATNSISKAVQEKRTLIDQACQAKYEPIAQTVNKQKLTDLRQQLSEKQAMLSKLKEDFYILARSTPSLRSASLRYRISMLTKTCAKLGRQISEEQKNLDVQLDQIRIQVKSCYAQELKEINEWGQDAIRELDQFVEAEATYETERLPEIGNAVWADALKDYLCERKSALNHAQLTKLLNRMLRAHFEQVITPLKGKKVFFDMDQFDLEHSVLETEDRSEDGGYIRSGIAYRIPADARYVRFFVYWNDCRRIDIDLHAGGVTIDGENLHIGWNADFRRDGVVHSGDITHSDAAEYIDVDLSAPIQKIWLNIHLFNDNSFEKIETCYVGLMAVAQNTQTIERYNPANCFFTHQLTQKTDRLFYGFLDVQNRYVRFIGKKNMRSMEARPVIESDQSRFSLREYLDIVMEGQGAQQTEEQAEADVVLTMGKSLLENGISLADNNFFLEC